MSEQHWVPDADLDPETREALREFTTPRIGPDGRTYWPADEVPGVLLPDALPPAWEREIERQDESDPGEEPETTEPAIQDVATVDRLIAAEVRRRQSARRTQRVGHGATGTMRPSRWVHVPLAQLFAAAGNRLSVRGNGVIECAHEPLHASKGGRCVAINPTTGLWWCRGCRRGGDAVTLVMDLEGCSAKEARARLTARFGPVPEPAPGKRVIEIELP
jgi:hypothetical protein